MMGFVSGIIMAIWFRKEGPQPPVYDWMFENEENSELNSQDLKQDKVDQESDETAK